MPFDLLKHTEQYCRVGGCGAAEHAGHFKEGPNWASRRLVLTLVHVRCVREEGVKKVQKHWQVSTEKYWMGRGGQLSNLLKTWIYSPDCPLITKRKELLSTAQLAATTDFCWKRQLKIKFKCCMGPRFFLWRWNEDETSELNLLICHLQDNQGGDNKRIPFAVLFNGSIVHRLINV